MQQKQEECKARLPAEPSDTDKDITRLKIRLPNDEGVLMRRFHINDNLQVGFSIVEKTRSSAKNAFLNFKYHELIDSFLKNL